MKYHREKGVTLVELAMVMVAVAFLYAIILVFQTLLEASKVRSQIIQIDAYKRAVTTFDLKYNGLPGDFNRANLYGLGDNGNGNRVIGDIVSEEAEFWTHLGNAAMIDFHPSGGTLPFAKIGYGFVAVYYNGTEQETYFHIGFPNDVNSDSFKPLQSYNIDLKIDEGNPLTGFVVATRAGLLGDGGYGQAPTQGSGGPDSDVCLNNATPVEYNYQNENTLCSLDVEIEY